MLKKICSEERDRYWCKLEVPSVNLESGAAGESERDDARIPAYHRRTDGRQETNFVVGQILGPKEHDSERQESTKNSRSDKMSFRKMREELQNSSGAEARGGEPAGLTGISTYRTASFPTCNTVSCS